MSSVDHLCTSEDGEGVTDFLAHTLLSFSLPFLEMTATPFAVIAAMHFSGGSPTSCVRDRTLLRISSS